MLNPEFADGLVLVRERETVASFWVRKEGLIEIHPQSIAPCPIDPALEVFRFKRISIDSLPARLGVKGVEVQPLSSAPKF